MSNTTGEATDFSYHLPVMLPEAVSALQIRPDGVYVDVTFGGGGHSKAILEALGPQGRLIAFDQDADAAANLPKDDRLLFIPQNFRHLQRFLRLHGIPPVDGILADLGVSSHQFDEGDRGFSTRFAGPLDMRMDRRTIKDAALVLNNYAEADLHKIFERFGEVTNAKTLAKLIVASRALKPFETVEGLKQTLAPVVKGNPHKYFAQVFQAIRIEVNDEMEALKDLLTQLPKALATGGHAAIITFHSLEDRLVKQFFKAGSFEEQEADEFGRRPQSPFELVNKKPLTASPEELKNNSRARSAKLRVARKK